MTPPADDHDTRTRLLDAGAELFTQKGFNGCGLSEVLQKAGVPKGSFYHHFGSKEQFGVALVARTFQEFADELEPLLGAADTSPLTRLRSVFEFIQSECSVSGPTHECLIPKLALETANLSEPMHAAVQDAYRRWAELLATVIREGQVAGEVRADLDALKLADSLIMLWEGATMRMQIDQSVAPLETFLGFAFESLLRPPGSQTDKATG